MLGEHTVVVMAWSLAVVWCDGTGHGVVLRVGVDNGSRQSDRCKDGG